MIINGTALGGYRTISDLLSDRSRIPQPYRLKLMHREIQSHLVDLIALRIMLIGQGGAYLLLEDLEVLDCI